MLCQTVDMAGHEDAPTLRCPEGHEGPFWFVEAIEVHREVRSDDGTTLCVDAAWSTGDGFDEGVEGSQYLLCRHRGQSGVCAERTEVPSDRVISWQ